MKAAIIVSTTSHFIVKGANNWKRECAQSFEKSRKDSKFKQEEKKKIAENTGLLHAFEEGKRAKKYIHF